MSKKILFAEEARKEIKIGVDAVANAVKITLGPSGRNVGMDKGWGNPMVTNDGISIAREIVLEDSIQNMGASFCKEVAQKTNDQAGDGTSTSIVLTQAILSEGLKKIAVGVNAMALRRGIEKASKLIIESLKSIAKPIKSEEEILQVATISAESKEIGKVISDTVAKLGKDAIITVEESPISGIISETSMGMEIDKGFISPYMMTNQDRGESEIKEAKILVTDLKIGAVQDILPLLEQMVSLGKTELVIIADDIVGESLHTLIINKIRGTFTALGIKAPGFGLRKRDYLEDIATLVGATLITSDLGMKLENVKIEHLGSADRIISNKEKTTIVGGKGNKEAVIQRVESIKKEIEKTESRHDVLKLEERIAKLQGTVAVIKIGGSTEVETKYLKLKLEDAVSAVKAALSEGIVPGGGIALIKSRQSIIKPEDMTFDEELGFNIVCKAVEVPLQQIAINSGGGDGSGVVDRVISMKNTPNGGYDALKGVYSDDLIKDGIIDPVKVTRSALENAVSTSGILLTLEVVMAEVKKEKNNLLDK